ncbi:MAG: hypothetical protein Q7S52_04815 [bacterium]|nr:hypothetical protein [bacterium]
MKNATKWFMFACFSLLLTTGFVFLPETPRMTLPQTLLLFGASTILSHTAIEIFVGLERPQNMPIIAAVFGFYSALFLFLVTWVSTFPDANPLQIGVMSSLSFGLTFLALVFVHRRHVPKHYRGRRGTVVMNYATGDTYWDAWFASKHKMELVPVRFHISGKVQLSLKDTNGSAVYDADVELRNFISPAVGMTQAALSNVVKEMLDKELGSMSNGRSAMDLTKYLRTSGNLIPIEQADGHLVVTATLRSLRLILV